MADLKSKPAASLRIPKPKKKLGLSVPPALRLPHDDLIYPGDESSKSSKSNISSMTSQPSMTSHTRDQEHPVAPERDFSKVANSIIRRAVPDGLFTGKSKQLYDCLYSLTRGAVVPSRVVRMSRPKLMKKSGIGSRITFDTNVERLIATGLIQVRQIAGEHQGNEYTVYLPEEAARTQTSQTSHSSSPLNTTTSSEPKTILKTDDDTHTLAGFIEVLLETARGVVGGEIANSKQEREHWKELGQILAEELRSAAQNADTISSVPAFLAAHLRRRLTRKAQPTPDKFREGRAKENEGKVEEGRKAVERPARSEAKSRFSIEECRRYAEQLHNTGQGITNPGGYATTIHRTGETDELIEKFLNPPISPPSIDASQCPNCNGTGWWYPKGPEMGVARCRHEHLINQPQQGAS